MANLTKVWVLRCEKPEPNDHDTPGNLWVFEDQRNAIESASTCDAFCEGPHQLYPVEVQPKRVYCSCGASFQLDSPEEERHFVWAIRADGTRSNLGECPIEQGSVTACVDRMMKNGHYWGRGFLYRGKVVY